MFDVLERTIEKIEDRSFENDKGEKVIYFVLILKNNKAETQEERLLELKVPLDMINKLDLKNPEITESLKGKKIVINGIFSSKKVAKISSKNTPYITTVHNYRVIDIEVIK